MICSERSLVITLIDISTQERAQITHCHRHQQLHRSRPFQSSKAMARWMTRLNQKPPHRFELVLVLMTEFTRCQPPAETGARQGQRCVNIPKGLAGGQFNPFRLQPGCCKINQRGAHRKNGLPQPLQETSNISPELLAPAEARYMRTNVLPGSRV